MAGLSWMRRTTNFASGISAGGGETSWDRTPQPMLITKRVTSANTTATASIPQGTVLLETWVMPVPQAQSTAGTVTMTDTTNGVVYVNAQTAASYQKASLTTIGELTTDAKFQITATGLDANTGVDVGLLVIPRRWQTSEAK